MPHNDAKPAAAPVFYHPQAAAAGIHYAPAYAHAGATGAPPMVPVHALAPQSAVAMGMSPMHTMHPSHAAMYASMHHQACRTQTCGMHCNKCQGRR